MASSTFFKLATGATFTLPGYPAKEDGTSVVYTKISATTARDDVGRVWSFSPALAIGAQGASGQSAAVPTSTGTGAGTGTGTGARGPQGIPGVPGKDGKDGIDGTNGVDGIDGTNGTNGTDGTNGTNGTNGTDGGTSYLLRPSNSSLAIATGSTVFVFTASIIYPDLLGWQIGSRVRAISSANSANYMEGVVTLVTSLLLPLRVVSVTVLVDTVGGSGTHSDFVLSLVGDPGATGGTGGTGAQGGSTSVFNYTADTSSTVGTPAAGFIRWNNATQPSATNLYINVTTNDALDVTLLLGLMAIANKLVIQDKGATGNQNWKISGTPSFSSGVFTIPITLISAGGTGSSGFANNESLSFSIVWIGQGVPVGGTTGQVLSKINSTDYNTQWTTAASGADVLQVQVFS